MVHKTPQDLRNFHIQKMWRVQPLSRRKGEDGNGPGTLGFQEQLQDCRGVHRDQPTSSSTCGFRLATHSNVRAAPDGTRRPCSQSCSVRSDTPSKPAKRALP